MNGMRGWRSQRSVPSVNITSSHQNQSPAIILAEGKRAKGGDEEWQEGGEKVEGEQN